jgi:hypothetical protein
MNNKDLLGAIITSNIMGDFISRDIELGDLLNATMNQTAKNWQVSNKVSINKRLIPAIEIDYIYKKRLQLLLTEIQTKNITDTDIIKLKDSVEQLLTYCSEHAQAHLKIVIFNSSKYSYQVFCGISDTKIEVVSATRSSHISG